ncbi:unnamed protein product [Ambrosiozyma monospora]|uniref:GPI ethanolamine phosphate transferase 2 n=1 Tax=Ambrosiozyma monospora TaxID=43982 RepID=A0A9W6Z6J3_AMBMO|nr:unnamed protein product [Ambrosiozyma monospora]
MFYTSLTYFILKPVLCQWVYQESGSSDYLNNILAVISLLLINQTNYLNVPLFTILFIILFTFEKVIERQHHEQIFSFTLPLFTILLQNLSFFQFGSTNTLSTVDLTNAFNGLHSYNMINSGILTFLTNWAGPIFWSLAYLKLASSASPDFKANRWHILFDKLVVYLLFYSIGGLILIGSCYNLRFHLFIWTVFSPKILYYLSWLSQNLLIDFGLSYLILLFYV